MLAVRDRAACLVELGRALGLVEESGEGTARASGGRVTRGRGSDAVAAAANGPNGPLWVVAEEDGSSSSTWLRSQETRGTETSVRGDFQGFVACRTPSWESDAPSLLERESQSSSDDFPQARLSLRPHASSGETVPAEFLFDRGFSQSCRSGSGAALSLDRGVDAATPGSGKRPGSSVSGTSDSRRNRVSSSQSADRLGAEKKGVPPFQEAVGMMWNTMSGEAAGPPPSATGMTWNLCGLTSLKPLDFSTADAGDVKSESKYVMGARSAGALGPVQGRESREGLPLSRGVHGSVRARGPLTEIPGYRGTGSRWVDRMGRKPGGTGSDVPDSHASWRRNQVARLGEFVGRRTWSFPGEDTFMNGLLWAAFDPRRHGKPGHAEKAVPTEVVRAARFMRGLGATKLCSSQRRVLSSLKRGRSMSSARTPGRGRSQRKRLASLGEEPPSEELRHDGAARLDPYGGVPHGVPRILVSMVSTSNCDARRSSKSVPRSGTEVDEPGQITLLEGNSVLESDPLLSSVKSLRGDVSRDPRRISEVFEPGSEPVAAEVFERREKPAVRGASEPRTRLASLDILAGSAKEEVVVGFTDCADSCRHSCWYWPIVFFFRMSCEVRIPTKNTVRCACGRAFRKRVCAWKNRCRNGSQ